jgi:hypothetical protein
MPASSGSFSTTAAEEKGKLSKEGFFVISWLWKHLGLSERVLDRVVNGLGAGLLDGLQERPIDGSSSGKVSGLISRSGSGPEPESSEVLCSVWVPVSSGPGSVADSGVGVGPVSGDGDGVGSSVGDGVVAGVGPTGSAVAVSAAGDGFVPAAGDGIVSADGYEVGSVVSVGFAAGGGPTGFSVADSAAGDGVALVAGDEVGSSISGAGEGSSFASPDPSFPVTSAQARWVAETASSLANERSSMSECSSSPDISDECSSPGFAENENIGDVIVTKSLAVSARKDSQAWFFGWVRASVQHDEKLLAKLDVIEERSRRTKVDALSPNRTIEMMQMQEKLASMDAERVQALAFAWLSEDEERL